ncbi:rubrerythrin family protein [bacterium]|nr:rubrerythrin family protein [bacterium]
MNFRGSKTEQQLLNAFAGESMARNRYTMFASIAKKEGYEQIAEIFEQTAHNEYEHAKLFYKHIGMTPDGNVNSCYPFILGSTEENLLSAIDGETEEYTTLYSNAEKIALEEGFDSVASTFKHIINSEKHHAHRFQQLYDNLINGTIFKKETEQKWICRECGFIHDGNCAPDYCPNCHHKKGYFQLLCEKY